MNTAGLIVGKSCHYQVHESLVARLNPHKFLATCHHLDGGQFTIFHLAPSGERTSRVGQTGYIYYALSSTLPSVRIGDCEQHGGTDGFSLLWIGVLESWTTRETVWMTASGDWSVRIFLLRGRIVFFHLDHNWFMSVTSSDNTNCQSFGWNDL